MKKSSLLIAFAISLAIIHPLATHAQWYKSYGVTNKNELTEDQCNEAMKKATTILNLGKATSIMGGVFALTGGLAFSSFYIVGAAYPSINFGAAILILSIAILGKGAMFLGGGLAAIGVPIWVTGSVRKRNIKTVLSGFPAKLALVPVVNKDFNHYSPGLSVVITF
jgi:Flp pilus assembly protein TadB